MLKNLNLYDYIKGEWVNVTFPNELTEDVAQRFIPNTEVARSKLSQYIKAGMTPYLATLTILSDGGK